jgi:hypothetical protein
MRPDARHDDAALEHALASEEVDGRCRAANHDHHRPRSHEVTGADQRRQRSLSELLRVAVAVDDAALGVLRHEPDRRGRVPAHTSIMRMVRGADPRSGDVADHDARGRGQLRELRRERHDLFQQGMARLDAVLTRGAPDRRPEQPHLRNVFPTSISRM